MADVGHGTSEEDLDRQLWERISRREGEALCELFDRRAPATLGMLSKVLGRSEAEVVLEEVFGDVWREAASLSLNGTSPFAWMLLRARARAVERLRCKPALPEVQVLPAMI